MSAVCVHCFTHPGFVNRDESVRQRFLLIAKPHSRFVVHLTEHLALTVTSGESSISAEFCAFIDNLSYLGLFIDAN